MPGETAMTVAVRSQPNPNFNINDNIATGVNTDVGVVGSDYANNNYGVSYNDRSGNDFVAANNTNGYPNNNYPQANNSNATNGVSGGVAAGSVAAAGTTDNRSSQDLTQPNPATDRPGDTSQLQIGNQKTDINSMVAERDRNFVLDAASGGIYEVQAGEKAVAKGSDATVKTLGQHMIDDHTKSNKELQALAQRKGIHVSTLPDADKIAMLGKLDSLNGSEFDKEFLRQQQTAHKDTIAKFEAAANSSADKDIRDWAAGTLPTLREHLAMINNDLNGTPNSNIGSERP